LRQADKVFLTVGGVNPKAQIGYDCRLGMCEMQ
jgi:hypothetical protein